MSIDRERFDSADEADLRNVSVPDQVLGFLASNDDRAFEAREVASRTELDVGAVSTALSRLKERGLVEHKASYWAVTADRDRLRRYDGYERATALFNERLGSEDEATWREHAPDDPHPSVEDES